MRDSTKPRRRSPFTVISTGSTQILLSAVYRTFDEMARDANARRRRRVHIGGRVEIADGGLRDIRGSRTREQSFLGGAGSYGSRADAEQRDAGAAFAHRARHAGQREVAVPAGDLLDREATSVGPHRKANRE